MDTVLNVIESPEPGWTILLIVLLYWVGALIVRVRPRAEVWGYRLAIVVFIAYATIGVVRFGPTTAFALITITVRGLFAAGLALGLSWILLPGSAAIAEAIVSRGRRLRSVLQGRAQKRDLQEEELQRLRAALHAKDREVASAETRRLETESANRRRTAARANAELVYSLFATTIGERYSRNDFHAYVQEFMSDKHSPDDVERRGRELIATLRQHESVTDPPERKKTLEDLAQWFLEQQALINRLPLEEKHKRLHMAELNARYAELSQQFLQGMEP